jgi:hypothetical protein
VAVWHGACLQVDVAQGSSKFTGTLKTSQAPAAGVLRPGSAPSDRDRGGSNYSLRCYTSTSASDSLVVYALGAEALTLKAICTRGNTLDHIFLAECPYHLTRSYT